MIIIPEIIYTLTDEAPALATYSLLPIIRTFTQSIGIQIKIKDISLASRIIACFPTFLYNHQILNDHLSELNKMISTLNVNIIKLPNISASLPQLKSAIRELQNQGYKIPNYPDNPENDAENKIKICYDTIKGSAVNPILRQGNSCRYIPKIIKNYAKKYPPKVGVWSKLSKSHVAHMKFGDFYGTEKSFTIKKNCNIAIFFIKKNGIRKILKEQIIVKAKDIIDAAVMHKKILNNFITQEIKNAKKQNLLLSVHLKSTMMKISDPIIFGIIVYEYYKDIFTRYSKILKPLKINFNNGISELYNKLNKLSYDQQIAIMQDLEKIYLKQPKLAMIDSNKRITNLHIPHGIIIDASMSAMIRDAGKMIGPNNLLYETKAIIPDRCYAGVYQTIIDDCKQKGSLDPKIIGSVSNIGLMANQAEEYGSNNTTFQIPENGIIQVVDDTKQILFEHKVEINDIYRFCLTKHTAIKNWIQLAIDYTKKQNYLAIFWLDSHRAHDLSLINKVRYYLKKYNNDLNIKIMSPIAATKFSLECIRAKKNIISITGNILRDYLTDLFPMIEVGNSAKTLSVISLMNHNGKLFETGSGGCAPKHVQQFIKENYLRWDSTGEILALHASLKHMQSCNQDTNTLILAKTLTQAYSKLLDNNRLPSYKVGTLDSRGSHFYLALYWAQALAEQNKNLLIKQKFAILANMLLKNENIIIKEINYVQGNNVILGGYYNPNYILLNEAMRPSSTFNNIISLFNFKY